MLLKLVPNKVHLQFSVSWSNYLVFNGFWLVEIERYITTNLPETTTLPPLLNTIKPSLFHRIRKEIENLSYLWGLVNKVRPRLSKKVINLCNKGWSMG